MELKLTLISGREHRLRRREKASALVTSRCSRSLRHKQQGVAAKKFKRKTTNNKQDKTPGHWQSCCLKQMDKIGAFMPTHKSSTYPLHDLPFSNSNYHIHNRTYTPQNCKYFKTFKLLGMTLSILFSQQTSCREFVRSFNQYCTVIVLFHKILINVNQHVVVDWCTSARSVKFVSVYLFFEALKLCIIASLGNGLRPPVPIKRKTCVLTPKKRRRVHRCFCTLLILALL